MNSLEGPPFETFTVDDFQLECGDTLPRATLAYQISGGNLSRPPILTCTAFTQNYDDLAYLRVPGAPLSQNDGWMIHTELLGNGRGTSPSQGRGPDFPQLSIRDNVRLQKILLDSLGIESLQAVIGASMGGQQAIQWAVSYPTMVQKAAVIVGSAQASLHVQLFLSSLASAIKSDPIFNNGNYAEPPLTGLSRMSETWAAWAFSPTFFSEGAYQLYDDTRAESVEAFLAKWRTRYHHKDANDILSHLSMWSGHDVAQSPDCEGSLEVALGRITADLLFLPCRTDAYFAVADVEREAGMVDHAQVAVIESNSGHAAGFGKSPSDREQIKRAIQTFLDDKPT
ncbi:MAG: alpha/beta fold hydrolase [Chloroflexota bacterium]